MKPLFKWSGGKTDELEQIKKHIPENIDCYLEPFVGGGAVYFNLCPARAVINDIHPELVEFYRAMASIDYTKIHEFMEQNENKEEIYYKIRSSIPTNTLETACRFYYLRKTCFRGMLRYNKKGQFNIPFGRYKTMNFSSIIDKKYHEVLSSAEIFNKDFEYLFSNYNSEANFMFLDPPYDSEFTDYGYCSFGKPEHIRLANLFKSTKIRCLMIIGKTDFIEKLYSDYIVDEYSKKYRFKIHSGRIGDEINTKHLVIRNY